MQGELSVLIGILEEQRDCQAALVELSESKIKAITEGNHAALQSIVEQEKGMLNHIKAVEGKQSGCTQRLAALLSVPQDALRMSLIIDKAQGKQKESLVHIREELSVLIEKQLKYNEINMKLLKMNMDYVQFLINSTTSQMASPTYGNGGIIQKTAGSPKRLLDRKV